jgi:hypothetical protein
MERQAELEFSDLPFVIGPTTEAAGFKRLSLREQVWIFVFPSDDAPDESGRHYFFIAAMHETIVERKRGKRTAWEVSAASVVGTKRPFRRDCVPTVLDSLYMNWRALEWTSHEVKLVDYNYFLYSSRQAWIDQAVLGK